MKNMMWLFVPIGGGVLIVLVIQLHRTGIDHSYEGIGALLSGLALCAITVSLIVQAKQSYVERTHIAAQRHFDLLSLAFYDFSLHSVIVSSSIDDPHTNRQWIYANLWMRYWYSSWRVGEINDADIERLARGMFRNSVSRQW